jgi:putative two-component system response regulator
MSTAQQVDPKSSGSSGIQADDALSSAQILRRVQSELAKPSEDAVEVAVTLFDRLRSVPSGSLDRDALDAHLCLAQLLYIAGRPELGLDPAAAASQAAVLQGDRTRQRKAFTFEGILLADCGNIALALERYAAALEIAQALEERSSLVALRINIGAALIYAALYSEAIENLEQALALSEGFPELAGPRETAMQNIALACIHTEDLARGLKAAKASVNSGAPLVSPTDCFMRVMSERNYVRLLLEVENLEKARERCELAKALALRAGTERAQLQAALSEGLYEVHAGLVDLGLSRLRKVLDRSRSNPQALRDTLIVMVRAHEVAGRPDEALQFLEELKSHTQAIQARNALLHHRIHVKRLELDPELSVDPAHGFFRRHERLIEGQQAQQKLLKAQIEQLERLAVTAELRDDSTGEHSYRVGRLAALLAREAGLDEQTCFTIDLAARLHDIGKIGIPDGILLKPGHLNAAEREIMETHTTVGAELLAKSDIPHMQVAEDIARHHHEWWAGGGYPAGISGETIPIAARVTALADVFDALTHKRPYKEPWPVARALDEIQRLRGSQFDPKLTDIFIALIHRLQREVGDLDEFLGAAARESSFNQARNRIAETLRRHPARRGYDRSLDPRL